jgi:hypothetical protein
MKKLMIAIALLALQRNLPAQDVLPPFKWIFKMSPQHLTQKVLKVGGEVFNESKTRSYQLFLQAVSDNKNGEYFCCDDFGYNGFGTEIGMRRYLLPFKEVTNRRGRQFTQGIYFSGFLQGGLYRGDFEGIDYVYDPGLNTSTPIAYDYTSNVRNVAVGFTIGLHRVIWKVLSLDVYMGAGYQASNEKMTGQKPDLNYYYYLLNSPRYYGILPKVGVYLGLTL